ncbi:MAG: O-antigen ligase family protein, partial [Flavobacteriales bacterium]|nr:O-antigen ligase family protein [Flavobacteriales bacterium]
AVGLIGDNWIFGVGTGDVKDELIARYAENGLTGIVEKRLNAHNQFLQSFAALGIFGFLSLLIALLAAAIYAIKRKNLVYFMFVIIIIVNALTESILEVQAGIVFYTFFNSLFMFLEPEQ